MQDPPDWTDILTHFRGSELQNYFTKILEDDLKAIIKPQYVDQIPKAVRGSVQQLLDKKDEMLNQIAVCNALGETRSGRHRGRGAVEVVGGRLLVGLARNDISSRRALKSQPSSGCRWVNCYGGRFRGTTVATGEL